LRFDDFVKPQFPLEDIEMIRNAKTVWVSLAAAALLLSACAKATEAPSPTPDPNTQLTVVAQTVSAERTRSAQLTPTLTKTPQPTATRAATATSSLPSATPTSAFTATATKSLVPDKAEFVSQNIADGTKFNPGTLFTLTWTVKNVGTSTWNTSYLLRLYAGNALGSPASIKFPKEVKPGESVELTLNMTAPAAGGSYQSTWVMTNASGVNFSNMYIIIEVTGAAATATTAATSTTAPTATTEPTATPTTGSGSG
jgi:hypothetical protein